MKSEFEFRPVTDDDIPVLQIAEMRGVSLAPMVDGVRFLAYGQTEYGFAPIALLDVKETEYVIEPHVTWMPWVSMRQKFESIKWAFSQWEKKKVIFLIVLKEYNALYEQFVKRKYLRKVGILKIQKEAGSEIHMYQRKVI